MFKVSFCIFVKGHVTYLEGIAAEEGLAGLARDGVEVVAERLVAAHAARLVLRPLGLVGRRADLMLLRVMLLKKDIFGLIV